MYGQGKDLIGTHAATVTVLYNRKDIINYYCEVQQSQLLYLCVYLS